MIMQQYVIYQTINPWVLSRQIVLQLTEKFFISFLHFYLQYFGNWKKTVVTAKTQLGKTKHFSDVLLQALLHPCFFLFVPKPD